MLALGGVQFQKAVACGREEHGDTTTDDNSGAFKGKVAVAVRRGDRTLSELASAVGVHPVQIEWKKRALTALPEAFATRRGRADADHFTVRYSRIAPTTVPLSCRSSESALLERLGSWAVAS